MESKANKTAVIEKTVYMVHATRWWGEEEGKHKLPYYAVDKKSATAYGIELVQADYNYIQIHEYVNAKIEVPHNTEKWNDVDWHNAIEAYLKAGNTPFGDCSELASKGVWENTLEYCTFQKRQLK